MKLWGDELLKNLSSAVKPDSFSSSATGPVRLNRVGGIMLTALPYAFADWISLSTLQFQS